MKPVAVLSAASGVDVLSPESELKSGAVRVAENVVIHSDGGFDRRPGAALALAASRPHSLWSNDSMAMFVAGGVLYRLTQIGTTLTAVQIATGLWNSWVRYAELGGDVYVSGGKILRVRADWSVTTPGVGSLFAFSPALTSTTGGLVAGTYGVAISALTADGEESGLSNVSWIDLPTGGGIAIMLPTLILPGATRYKLYRTTANGDVLYHAETVAAGTSFTLAGGDIGHAERTWMRDLLPAGTEIASYHGRLYSALGKFLYYSEPFMPGLFDARHGFFSFGEECDRMVQPVDGGIYVGTDSAIYFMRGDGPGSFTRDVVARNGAFKHSSRLVPAEHFSGLKTTKPVAVWLSPKGYQIGLPDGTVLSPQEDRIRLSNIERAPTTAFLLGGVKQLVSAVETMTLGNGGATDTTP